MDQPLYWDFAEVLNITPHPDILILADLCTYYTVIEECVVNNPGNFSSSRTFSLITPYAEKESRV